MSAQSANDGRGPSLLSFKKAFTLDPTGPMTLNTRLSSAKEDEWWLDWVSPGAAEPFPPGHSDFTVSRWHG